MEIQMDKKTRPLHAFIPLVMLIFAAMACAQDCLGGSFSVKGYVVDEQNNPIPNARIRAWNNGSFERPAFELDTMSNADGYFDTDSVFSYGCTTFQVEVFAPGFETTTLGFYPPTQGMPDELPSEIIVQLQPLADG
jgi:hypothetical protein